MLARQFPESQWGATRRKATQSEQRLEPLAARPTTAGQAPAVRENQMKETK